MIVLIALSVCSLSPEPCVYDFYFQSVKKGSSTVSQASDTVLLTSEPGFAAGSKVEVTLASEKPTTVVFRPKTGEQVIYAFNIPAESPGRRIDKSALYSPTQPGLLPFLLAEFDRSKPGFQALPATDLTKGTPRAISVELFRTETKRIRDKNLVLKEWRLDSPPTAEAVIWTDERNWPLYWWVPAQNFEIVRRGYEVLRPSARFEKSVSPPRFDAKVEKDVSIPMRDGVRLMADVYRPADSAAHPVILQRTCYDRSEFGNADGEFFAQRGYVYVTEHVRGRGSSEGDFHVAKHEDLDGYDSVAWCGTQPWSDGGVGMIGASYNGFCTWAAAKTKPHWLKTIVSVVPMAGPPFGEPWDGGAVYVGADLAWFGLLRDRAKVQAYNDDLTKAINTLPISKADEVQFGHRIPQYQEMIHAVSYDASVREASYRDQIANIDIPVLHFDGWLDTVGVSTRLNYAQMVAHRAAFQKLIWGPWNHFTNRESRDGSFDFTPDGYVDMRTITLRWFDRWLKNMPNGIEREPSVDQFLLGQNRWYHTNTWPPRNMKPQRWFLQDSSKLSTRTPRLAPAGPSRYIYDPAKCVYTNSSPVSYFFARGSNTSELCKQPGQILFDSTPLKRPITLDGPIRGKLFAATSAKDTDWVMALLDVFPDGRSVGLASGMIRARFRKSFAKPELLKPGVVYGYDIDLWQMGITIPAGHRLRVVVCSTLFPDKDKNLNTGEPIADATRMVSAQQSVYHEPGRASYIELPVLAGDQVG